MVPRVKMKFGGGGLSLVVVSLFLFLFLFFPCRFLCFSLKDLQSCAEQFPGSRTA